MKSMTQATKYLFGFLMIFIMSLTGCGQVSVERDRDAGEERFGSEFALTSLLGKELYTLDVSDKLIENYDQARRNFTADPDEENTIWLGRRLAYLSRYQQAIDVYTEGLKRFPNSYKLYRHRGHRNISLRKFPEAIADFKKAAELIEGVPLEVEPDGAPNPAGIPTSNTQFNIWYHMGLAYYLSGDFESAEKAYQECLKWSKNDDSIVATVDWLYMTYRRMGKDDQAAQLLTRIDVNMNLLESDSYHKRLLMYKGLISPESLIDPDNIGAIDPDMNIATQGYGVGNWYYYSGQIEKARQVYEKVLAGKSWSAFGYIAAEVDLYNLKSDLKD
ncbi:tetratricopeptide repeat protein [Planctomycetota bacterium]